MILAPSYDVLKVCKPGQRLWSFPFFSFIQLSIYLLAPVLL